jgi:hypothetical protein
MTTLEEARKRPIRAERSIEIRLDGKQYEFFRGSGQEIYRPYHTWSCSNGRTHDEIICPFCNEELFVYRWSFWGGGKKCDCGAKLEPMAAYRKLNVP